MAISEHARLGLAYGMSLLSYWANRKPHPFSASFAVTNKCNLRCHYCNTPYLDPNDLPLDKVEVVFRHLRDLGVNRLGLLGGEPLVRKDIGEIVTLGKKLGFYVSVNSNLNLYERRREVFDDVDLVMTSLDGDADHHRANRGEKSYDGVIEAIEDLRRRNKPVMAIAVINENNLDQPEKLLRQAEDLGFLVHFQPQCSDTDIVRGTIADELDDHTLRQFWVDLAAQKKAGRPIASSHAYLAAQSEWHDFRVSAYKDPKVQCAAGRGFLYVDPQGNAYPCAYSKGKCDPVNLLEEDWRKGFPGTTPCTVCNVGPMMEFNLLFAQPLRASWEALERISPA